MKPGILMILTTMLALHATTEAWSAPESFEVQRPDSHTVRGQYWGEVRNDVPTIIMMHGFPDGQLAYELVAPLLAETHPIVTFDFLGWGESDQPAGQPYNAASLYRDLGAVIDGLGLEQVWLVAHDLSGLPAIDWALDHPDQVERLVLLNTVYLPSPSLVSPDYIDVFATAGPRRVQALTRWTDDNWWRELFVDQMKGFAMRDAVFQRYASRFLAQSYDARPAFVQLAQSIRPAIGARNARRLAISQFPNEVIIIFGADDPTMNPAVGRELADVFPRSQLHIVEQAGHFVQLDQPAEVARYVRGRH